MLPHSRAPRHHPPNRRGLSPRCWSYAAFALLALCVALPFLLWHNSLAALLPGPRAGALTPLQRLQQQKALREQQQQPHASAATTATAAAAGVPQATPGHPAGQLSSVSVTQQQVAAAQAYLEAMLHPTRRKAVQASKYVIEPEPHDMRQQHKRVKAYLASAEFAAQQAARRASGGRGIIINAGGPQLLSSAMVTLKVLREELNCTLPVELVWHSSSEMDAATLAALQARWGPIRGVDLSQRPWPSHHRRSPGLERTQAAAGATAAAGTAAAGMAAGAGTAEAPAAAAATAAGALPAAKTGGGEEEETHLAPERAAAKQRGFLYKVWSLAASSFASALLLDADNLPLQDPAGLWEDPSFKLYGNVFWPDFWPAGTSAESLDLMYDMVGLEAGTAAGLLSAGKGPAGMSWRGTESGQVLLDLTRHGDTVEWALWINSFGDSVYQALWGDKDTYALAFAVAGKAHEFNQVQVPPAGAFAWRPNSVLVKASNSTIDGWQLAGMVQFNSWAQGTFLHRTMNKLSYGGDAWELGLLTAPLTQKWIRYFLALDSQGPTVGVPVTYAAPAPAFHTRCIQQQQPTAPAQPSQEPQVEIAAQPGSRGAANNSKSTQGPQTAPPDFECPEESFKAYWALRQQAAPVGPVPALDAACRTHLASLLGPLLSEDTQHGTAGLDVHPELLAVGQLSSRSAAQDFAAVPVGLSAHNSNSRQGYYDAGQDSERGDATPAVAWALPAQHASGQGWDGQSSVARVIAASHAALQWIGQQAQEFPLLLAAEGSNRDAAVANSSRDSSRGSNGGSSGGGSSSFGGGSGGSGGSAILQTAAPP